MHFIDKSNSIIEEKNPKIIIQNNVSTNSNGYTPTNEELDLLKEHQMQHTVLVAQALLQVFTTALLQHLIKPARVLSQNVM